MPVRILLLVAAICLSILAVFLGGRSSLFAILCSAFGAAITAIVALSAIKDLRKIDRQEQAPSAAQRSRYAEFEAIAKVADAILITSPAGRISFINAAAADLFGNVIGKSFSGVVGADACRSILTESGPRDWSGEIVGERADGTSFDGLLKATPILEGGDIAGALAIVHDVSRDKSDRESILQSEKMITLGELVAGTSHELNNPLAIVTGYSDLLLEDGRLTGEQREKLESIRKNALRASTIVHSLLAFARKRKPERLSTDVNQVVEAAGRLKEYDLRTSNISFERRLAPDLGRVFADPNQLQQVLLNIINNAQDAVAAGSKNSRIIISTEASGRNILIKVQDTGGGISRSDLKKVFDPFFTTKQVGKGTGLGLSISYGIIREHGGEIRIESREGEGTEVTIELPIDQSVPVQALKLAELPEEGTPMKVLVVDDEAEITSILQRGLSIGGTVVDTAGNLAEALSRALTNEYDFVVCDVKMPGGSGIDLYNQLCASKPAYRQRIVFLTGDGSNADTIQFFDDHGLTYFSKPFDIAAMHKFLREQKK